MMTETSARAEPIETWSDGYSAWARLLEGTARTLWVVDHDLSGLHPDRGDFPDALQRCLRRLSPERVRILVRDIQPLLVRMPRTRQVLIDYAHVATVRVIASHHADVLDRSVVVSDETRLIVRPRYDRPRAWLRLDDPAAAAAEIPQLETIWGAATNTSIGAVLGL
jgi:hypothetical protein